jgi:hypothetical protein
MLSGAKEFNFFVPQLLQDAEVRSLLKTEFKVTDGDENRFETDLSDHVYDFLFDYIMNNAEEVDAIEINLNEDPDETDFNIYNYVIRGLKGVFFTDTADDDIRFFDDYEVARDSIELNHMVIIPEKDASQDRDLRKRISAAQMIISDDQFS